MPKFATTLLILGLLLTACSPAPAEPTPTATAAPPATETPEPSATPTEDLPEINFRFYDSSPVIANGEREHWTGKWLNPGGVVVADGVFHMFLNAFHAWPGEVSIGHFTSEDGYSWELAEAEPIFTSEDVPYLNSGQGADVSSVVVLPDGTWALYFHTVTGTNGAGVGMATAPGPEGPWTFTDGPVVMPGQGADWDNYTIEWPNVVTTDDGFVMYYTGGNVRGLKAIGMATSPDGYTWTKYNDPDTEDGEHANSDPVIVGSGGFEGGTADRPRAVYTPEDGWVMFYTGSTLNARGLAFSEDGIQWEQFAGNPVITSLDFQSLGGSTWDTNLTYHDGVYYYYMEIGSLAYTQIFLTTYEGSLRP